MNDKLLYKFLILLLATFAFSCGNQQESSNDNPNNTTVTTTDTHTFSKPQEVQMTHLDLDIEVDFEQKIIKGTATLTLENKSNASKVYLDSRDLTIEKVTYEDGTEAKLSLSETVEYLGQALEIDILPETKKITIQYQSSPKASALQWLTPQQTADKKHPFLFTQSQAILARSWVPCQDSPGIRFTYHAKVKVPKDLLAVMSAENPIEKNETGIYEFKMPQPIPAYLLALSVGDFQFEKLSERAGIYAEPSVLEKSVYEFGDLEAMIVAAEEIYGKYEWGRYDLIVLPPSFPFGGMENPRLTFATPTILAGDRSLVSLVAHELAHSWSGNLVTNATWDDFWLNEGFTVFFERKIMEAIEGEAYAEMLAELGYQDLLETIEELGEDSPDTQLKLNLTDRDPDEGVTNIAYEKGYFFLRMIAESVGKEKFDTFLKTYFEKNKFQVMDTEKFLVYLQKELPETKELNLEEWIYKPGLPENCPKPHSERFQAVNESFTAWQGGKKASELETKDWSSHEWLHFIRQLPETLSPEQMKDLDDAFGFTKSGNSEVLAAWLTKVIPNEYEAAYPAIEEFLMNVGRRKFLVPLYQALLKTEAGTTMAKDIYAKARSNYHFVATNTLDEMLN